MVSIGCLVVSEEVIVAAVCCQVWFLFSIQLYCFTHALPSLITWQLYSNRRDGLDVLEPNGVDERIIRWKHLAAKSWKAGKDKKISCKRKKRTMWTRKKPNYCKWRWVSRIFSDGTKLESYLSFVDASAPAAKVFYQWWHVSQQALLW